MTPQHGPPYTKNCPLHIKPNHPLNAAELVVRCVECGSWGWHYLHLEFHCSRGVTGVAHLGSDTTP